MLQKRTSQMTNNDLSQQHCFLLSGVSDKSIHKSHLFIGKSQLYNVIALFGPVAVHGVLQIKAAQLGGRSRFSNMVRRREVLDLFGREGPVVCNIYKHLALVFESLCDSWHRAPETICDSSGALFHHKVLKCDFFHLSCPRLTWVQVLTGGKGFVNTAGCVCFINQRL